MKNKLALSPTPKSKERRAQQSNRRKRSLLEGEVSVQSFKHYLLDIQLLAYRLKKHSIMPVTVKASGFYMLLMLHGQSEFEDDAGLSIAKAYANSGAIAYVKAGAYQRMLPKGMHKLVILNFRPDWFKRKVGQMEVFKPLIDHFDADIACCVLPNCAVANGIFKLFKKLRLHVNDAESDMGVIEFLNHTVDRYQQKLAAGHYDTKTIHELKAIALAAFVKNNFADELVGNAEAIARKFTISKRMLSRLSLMAFGRPLHKQIMELRLLYGLKALMSTRLPVQQIARQMGYADPYYFSRAFRNRFGVSPSEVRLT